MLEVLVVSLFIGYLCNQFLITRVGEAVSWVLAATVILVVALAISLVFALLVTYPMR